MSKQQKTPWFPPSIKPVRKGEYEVCPCYTLPDLLEGGEGAFKMRWDGFVWLQQESTRPAVIQSRYRRGLTAPAKEAAHG
jgi:hypothetical protein